VVHQGFQEGGHPAHPVRHGRDRDAGPLPLVDPLLPVQGTVVTVLAHHHLGQQRRSRRTPAHDLASVGFILRGSILRRFSRCGSPGCACHTDPERLHGPYWQWTAKVKGKTVTRNLNEEQLARYQQWMDNAKRFDEIVADLQEISAQAHALLVAQERGPDRKPSIRKASTAPAPRRRKRPPSGS